ncbi:hypothetical protein MMC34_007974 [Xylographa carneopallida]|nr:hypothetical protein [Xylographa carneopallida]
MRSSRLIRSITGSLLNTRSGTPLPVSRAALICRSINTPTGSRVDSHGITHAKKNPLNPAVVIGVAASLLLTTAWQCSSTVFAEAPEDRATEEQSQSVGLRSLRLAEVRQHDEHSGTPWVISGTSVYDITDWISGHPGGNVILRAAGGSIEPYWKIFKIHHKQDVYDILEAYRIGEIDPQDLIEGKVPAEAIDDPFIGDPQRDQRLRTHTDRPCNAETPASELTTFVTPNQLFYVRNHLWVPRLDESSYTLVIELIDGEEKIYTLSDLKTKFKQFKITSTLQCSGNRRKHMTDGARPTNGLPWEQGAIGNADWMGPRLRDVLADAGMPIDDPPENAKHAQFVGTESYGASVPLAKVIDPRGDVLLACSMNGQDLPPDHGFPVRVIVPGHVAARSVKWVNRVIISEEESTSQWQRSDYKCFGPNDDKKPDWSRAPAIQETPVQSAITIIRELSGPSDREATVVIEGYATSGGGRSIVRVDVSTDNGKTWDQAEIERHAVCGSKDWSWKRWRYTVPKGSMGSMVVVKAVDEAYNCQPETYGPIYNLRGNLASAWHRVPFEPH